MLHSCRLLGIRACVREKGTAPSCKCSTHVGQRDVSDSPITPPFVFGHDLWWKQYTSTVAEFMVRMIYGRNSKNVDTRIAYLESKFYPKNILECQKSFLSKNEHRTPALLPHVGTRRAPQILPLGVQHPKRTCHYCCTCVMRGTSCHKVIKIQQAGHWQQPARCGGRNAAYWRLATTHEV
jgi:hypothetical protein